MMANTMAIENKTILATGDSVVGRRKNTVASKQKSSGSLVLIVAMFIYWCGSGFILWHSN